MTCQLPTIEEVATNTRQGLRGSEAGRTPCNSLARNSWSSSGHKLLFSIITNALIGDFFHHWISAARYQPCVVYRLRRYSACFRCHCATLAILQQACCYLVTCSWDKGTCSTSRRYHDRRETHWRHVVINGRNDKCIS